MNKTNMFAIAGLTISLVIGSITGCTSMPQDPAFQARRAELTKTLKPGQYLDFENVVRDPLGRVAQVMPRGCSVLAEDIVFCESKAHMAQRAADVERLAEKLAAHQQEASTKLVVASK